LTRLACILLAAGSSARMGSPKLLERLTDKTVFETALANHLASKIPVVCAVVPGWIEGFEALGRAQGDDRLRFVEVTEPCSMAESLKAGWRCLKTEYEPDAVMISLADKPLVTAGLIDLMMEAYENSKMPICVPVHRGTRGHPVIIACDLEDEIMAASGDMGAREVLARHPDEIEEIDVGTDAVLVDVDSVEDLTLVRSRLESNG
jgi:molybdenum cofactor cytidylyltransferase